MAHRSALVAISSIQLVAQLAGQMIALRRRRHFDVPFLAGSPEHVARDWLWFGTAYSAPSYMVAAQTWAVARLFRGPDARARQVLGLLGAAMCFGIAGERCTRVRIRRSGFDPVETPIVVVGWSAAIAMAVLGRGSLMVRDSPAAASGMRPA